MYGSKRVAVRDLNPHILCALCGGYLIQATTVIECLHSFCRSCIVKFLDTSKVCPICDAQIHKTRPLLNIRPDQTLQSLVYKLVPGLFQDEMRRRREFHSTLPRSDLEELSLEERGEAQMEREYRHGDDHISLVLQMASMSKDDERFEIRDSRYLLCPSEVTVRHLKKFICAKFQLSKYEINLFRAKEELTDDLMLQDIAFIYNWKRDKPMHIVYTVTETSSPVSSKTATNAAEQPTVAPRLLASVSNSSEIPELSPSTNNTQPSQMMQEVSAEGSSTIITPDTPLVPVLSVPSPSSPPLSLSPLFSPPFSSTPATSVPSYSASKGLPTTTTVTVVQPSVTSDSSALLPSVVSASVPAATTETDNSEIPESRLSAIRTKNNSSVVSPKDKHSKTPPFRSRKDSLPTLELAPNISKEGCAILSSSLVVVDRSSLSPPVLQPQVPHNPSSSHQKSHPKSQQPQSYLLLQPPAPCADQHDISPTRALQPPPFDNLQTNSRHASENLPQYNQHQQRSHSSTHTPSPNCKPSLVPQRTSSTSPSSLHPRQSMPQQQSEQDPSKLMHSVHAILNRPSTPRRRNEAVPSKPPLSQSVSSLQWTPLAEHGKTFTASCSSPVTYTSTSSVSTPNQLNQMKHRRESHTFSSQTEGRSPLKVEEAKESSQSMTVALNDKVRRDYQEQKPKLQHREGTKLTSVVNGVAILQSSVVKTEDKHSALKAENVYPKIKKDYSKIGAIKEGNSDMKCVNKEVSMNGEGANFNNNSKNIKNNNIPENGRQSSMTASSPAMDLFKRSMPIKKDAKYASTISPEIKSELPSGSCLKESKSDLRDLKMKEPKYVLNSMKNDALKTSALPSHKAEVRRCFPLQKEVNGAEVRHGLIKSEPVQHVSSTPNPKRTAPPGLSDTCQPGRCSSSKQSDPTPVSSSMSIATSLMHHKSVSSPIQVTASAPGPHFPPSAPSPNPIPSFAANHQPHKKQKFFPSDDDISSYIPKYQRHKELYMGKRSVSCIEELSSAAAVRDKAAAPQLMEKRNWKKRKLSTLEFDPSVSICSPVRQSSAVDNANKVRGASEIPKSSTNPGGDSGYLSFSSGVNLSDSASSSANRGSVPAPRTAYSPSISSATPITAAMPFIAAPVSAPSHHMVSYLPLVGNIRVEPKTANIPTTTTSTRISSSSTSVNNMNEPANSNSAVSGNHKNKYIPPTTVQVTPHTSFNNGRSSFVSSGGNNPLLTNQDTPTKYTHNKSSAIAGISNTAETNFSKTITPKMMNRVTGEVSNSRTSEGEKNNRQPVGDSHPHQKALGSSLMNITVDVASGGSPTGTTSSSTSPAADVTSPGTEDRADNSSLVELHVVSTCGKSYLPPQCTGRKISPLDLSSSKK